MLIKTNPVEVIEFFAVMQIEKIKLENAIKSVNRLRDEQVSENNELRKNHIFALDDKTPTPTHLPPTYHFSRQIEGNILYWKFEGKL